LKFLRRTAGRLSEAVAHAIRWSGLSALIRNTVAYRKASILLYHDPAPDLMERHLDYLVKRYHIVPLAQLVDAITARNWRIMPPKSLVITFDDGVRHNADLLHLFERYSVQPTIYVCSQIVGRDRHYWFHEIDDSESLKALSTADRLAVLARQVGFAPLKDYPAEQRQALNREEIAAMSQQVDFQSHTRFHPVLTTCSDAECREEIELSRREVEELSGKPCRHFSYPNGDYTEREVTLVKGAGYASGRTIDLGWNDAHSDPYRLKVLSWRDDTSVDRLAADLSGIPGFFSRLRRGSIRGRHRTVRLT